MRCGREGYASEAERGAASLSRLSSRRAKDQQEGIMYDHIPVQHGTAGFSSLIKSPDIHVTDTGASVTVRRTPIEPNGEEGLRYIDCAIALPDVAGCCERNDSIAPQADCALPRDRVLFGALSCGCYFSA